MGDSSHCRHGRKEGWAAVPLHRQLGPRLIQCGLGRGSLPYQVASSSIQPFGHNRNGPKIGEGAPPPFWGGAGSPSNIKSPGPSPTSIQSGLLIHAAIWPQQIWAKIWGPPPPLWGRGAGSSSNTMWPALRPACIPSFILIPPTVWPQYTNVTDRHDRQTDS